MDLLSELDKLLQVSSQSQPAKHSSPLQVKATNKSEAIHSSVEKNEEELI